MTVMEAPGRSPDQRLDALNVANRVRIYRAAVKRDVKAGRLSVPALLLDPPGDLATMKVVELLLAMPRVGRVKANKVLEYARVSPSKTLVGLSARQRAAVTERLKR